LASVVNTFLAKKYLDYKLKAKNEHSIHSPFVFELYCNAIKNDSLYYVFNDLKKLRHGLEADNTVLTIEDLGAGSKHFKDGKRKVSDIAKHGITSEKNSRLLFRLVEYFHPENIVELGTSLGVNTLYLASPSLKSKVTTLEGSKSLCEFAGNLFRQRKQKNIEVVEGNFDKTFAEVIKKIKRLDFLFIDGNHKKNPTLNYFETALQKIHNDSVFVMDDIYWSEEMESAWQEIKKHPRVTLTIDLFQFGIVFFRSEHKVKEHFVLRF
jgi:predicted O-methyltransferase YrrM